MEPNSGAEWDNTPLGLERVKTSGFYEEPDDESKNGFFAGRHIIGRDTQINGGVYVGSGKREAIVVDDKKYPEELDGVYNQLITRIQAAGSEYKDSILGDVYSLVQEVLPFNETGVLTLVQSVTSSAKGNDTKVPLNEFIKSKVGVCRHEALLVGYLLERLKKNGIISPKNISIDRNFIPHRGGHAWVRYENSEGKIGIIDPAQNFIGSLEDANKLAGWDYNRPSKVPAYQRFINVLASRLKKSLVCRHF